MPIVAVAAAGWLGFNALSERGPLISITLQSADGLEPGRTRVRHKQVELGVVRDLVPSADLSHVTVHARMNRYADGHLNAGTQFWVVRPRLSAQGVSGIGTLISGSFIEMQPGDGKPERRFTALEDPPVVSADVAGTEYVLHARRLGSVSQGSPVSYRGVEVGEVLGYTLSDQDGSATLRVFVRKPHDALVHEGTRFWNASGVSVSLGSDGVRLQTESLEALLAGGVAFDVPPGGEGGALAKAGSAFDLYADQDAARAALYTAARQWEKAGAAAWERSELDSAEMMSLQALHVAKRISLDVSERVFDICGARATFRTLPLEQIYRDVRTFTLHFRDDLYMVRVAEGLLDPSSFEAKGKYKRLDGAPVPPQGA